MDSLNYSVETAQFLDSILRKQKFSFALLSRIFLLATRLTCSITWSGHVTKRGINTRRSVTIFSCSVPLTCLNTRGETLLLLILNFSSLLFLAYQFFSSFGASENILRHSQIVSLPNSNFISSKIFYDIFKLCLYLIPIAPHRKCSRTFSNCALAQNLYSCHWNLNSVH